MFYLIGRIAVPSAAIGGRKIVSWASRVDLRNTLYFSVVDYSNQTQEAQLFAVTGVPAFPLLPFRMTVTYNSEITYSEARSEFDYEISYCFQL